MRKFIWLIAGLLTVGIGALVVAPAFVDWSQYKSIVQDEVRSITGRDLKIAGRVHITLWPTPALIAEGITFANLPGSHSPNMASLKALEAKVAFGPLLSGKLKIESVKLAEPIIELERLADGRANWDITLSKKAEKKSTKEKTSSHINLAQTPGGPKILLDNLTIENGTIIYRNAVTQKIETLTDINAIVRAASVRGPIETSGTMALRGTPLSYSMSLGKIIHQRTIPFSAELSLQSGGLSAKIVGSAINLSDTPQFKGSINVKSEDIRTTLLSLGAIPPTIAAPMPLDFSGQMVASTSVIDIKDLRVSLLNIQAKGDLQVDLDEKPRFSSQLAINQIDVDKLLSTLDGAPANRQLQSSDAPKPVSTRKNQSKGGKKFKKASKTIRFSLPTNIDGSAIITIDAMGYKSEIIRGVLVNIELKDSALLLRQFSAQIPGDSDISIQGQLITKKHIPNFSGSIIGIVRDLPNVMTWLSIPPPPVPAGRLRRLNFKSRVSATPEQIRLTGLNLGFDSSQLQGGITIALRKRPSFGIALTLNRFDADAYFPVGKGSKKLIKNRSFKKKPPRMFTKSSTQKIPKKHLNTLSALNAFDANFNLRVKSAVLRGSPVKDVIAEGKLYNGVLDLKRLSFGKLAGASAKISGTLAGLASIPEAQNIKFSAKISNLDRHTRIYGAKLPPILKKVDPVSINGRLNGNLLAPKLDATAAIAGAAITYRGQISAMPLADMLSGKITFQHANLPQFLRRLGIDYRPAGQIGGVDFSADITGSPDAMDLRKLRGRIGKTAIWGALSAQFSHSKPLLKADLTTGALNLENFLPAQNKASFRGLTPRLLPASWQVPIKPIPSRTPLLHLTATRKWPTNPLDLSALNNVNADMTLKAPLIIYHRYLFEKATITAKIRNGVLEIPRLNTSLFGGAVSGYAQATAKGNQITSSLHISNLDLEEALKTNSRNPAVNGRMNITVDVSSAGQSFSNIISALDGRANFTVTNINLDKVRQSFLLSGLLKHLVQPNSLGNRAAINKASISGSFKITNGIAKTYDLKLTSAVSNGKATGDIHFPNRTIDINGQLTLAEGPLMKILKANVREARNVIPFAIKGPLENPRVRVDTKAALNRSLRIPKADKLLRKTPKELRTILKGILRGTIEKQ